MAIIDPVKRWIRYWLDAWWHQVITWTNGDLLLVMSCGIHLASISEEMLTIYFFDTILKNTDLNLQPTFLFCRFQWREDIGQKITHEVYYDVLNRDFETGITSKLTKCDIYYRYSLICTKRAIVK